jgi:hypothetical protein
MLVSTSVSKQHILWQITGNRFMPGVFLSLNQTKEIITLSIYWLFESVNVSGPGNSNLATYTLYNTWQFLLGILCTIRDSSYLAYFVQYVTVPTWHTLYNTWQFLLGILCAIRDRSYLAPLYSVWKDGSFYLAPQTLVKRKVTVPTRLLFFVQKRDSSYFFHTLYKSSSSCIVMLPPCTVTM